MTSTTISGWYRIKSILANEQQVPELERLRLRAEHWLAAGTGLVLLFLPMMFLVRRFLR